MSSEHEKAMNDFVAKPQEPEIQKSWDGYDIPVSCLTADRECGMCDLTDQQRTSMGCTVNPFEEEN